MHRTRSVHLSPLINSIFKRAACGGGGGGSNRKGLVLGCYDGCSPGEFKLTKTASDFDKKVSGKLSELLRGTGVPLGQAALFSNLGDEFYAVAVGGLGEEGLGFDSMERLNVCKENIRIGAGLAAKKLQDVGVGQIFVEGFTTFEPAAEGVSLSLWKYQDLKNPEKRTPNPALEPFGTEEKDLWQRGMCKGEAQNLARYLEEVPANLMTPTIFAENCVESLCGCGAQVDVRDQDWIETKKMGAFLAIARTSCEPPLFLELKYCGGNPADTPVVLIGKGITYDTGGLCLKNKHIMSEYRGDLAGAAVVMATIRCIARMALPINVIGLVPLCENMIGGLATKPGDVVVASNGKTIRITDPDNEGRVILADAVVYSAFHKPCLVISISTLTPGMKKTLGSSASGVYTNSNEVWVEMDRAGSETGDRLWRFPSFWEIYKRNITDYSGVDVNNVGLQPGNAGQAAAFLKEFLHPTDFAHIDITGTGMLATGIGHPYLAAGVMSGRPTRSIVQFLYQIACPHDPGEDC